MEGSLLLFLQKCTVLNGSERFCTILYESERS